MQKLQFERFPKLVCFHSNGWRPAPLTAGGVRSGSSNATYSSTSTPQAGTTNFTNPLRCFFSSEPVIEQTDQNGNRAAFKGFPAAFRVDSLCAIDLCSGMKACWLIGWMFISIATANSAEQGVFVRFRMSQPAETRYFVRVGGHIHVPNWGLPDASIPKDAEKKANLRVASGEFTEWFDLKTHAGKGLHKRLNRAGGIAELPNITARFVADNPSKRREIDIELATAPDPTAVVKRWHESFEGDFTSFLVSPNLKRTRSSLKLPPR